VWAEGADYLADAAAIGVSLLATHLSSRAPTPKHPAGYPRATRYAAAVNGGWLLLLSTLVAAGSAERLIAGVPEVHGLPVLIVSGAAAVVMLVSALLLGADIAENGDGDDDLNVRAVVLDTAADAAAAAGVAVTGAVIYAAHGIYWLDPAVALVIAAVVAYHAIRLLSLIRTSLSR
jgi:cobalt-zinc-cadmium efflux system protein